MSHNRLSRTQVRAAIARVLADGTPQDIDTIARLDGRGLTGEHYRRWVIQGKNGIHLDGFHRPGSGWLTSLAALARFRAALEIATVPLEEQVK